MHTMINIEECRTCSMYLSETKDTVRCNRLGDYIVLAHVMPLYDLKEDRMTRVVHCNKEARKLYYKRT